jgi:uncharacterized protein
MLYLDTSVLLPLCADEPHSEKVISYLASCGRADTVISDWTVTEFYSAIGRRFRDKKITRRQADQAVDALERRFSQGLILFQLTDEDQILAQGFLRKWQTAIKSGDALHAAATKRLQAHLLTRDRAFLRFALTHALTASNPAP